LIIEPDNDGLIPSRGVLGFAEKAQAAGVDVTVHRIPHSNHIYDELFAGSIGNQAGLTIRQRQTRSSSVADDDAVTFAAHSASCPGWHPTTGARGS
jgi:acetyl esterase/lipase